MSNLAVISSNPCFMLALLLLVALELIEGGVGGINLFRLCSDPYLSKEFLIESNFCIDEIGREAAILDDNGCVFSLLSSIAEYFRSKSFSSSSSCLSSSLNYSSLSFNAYFFIANSLSFSFSAASLLCISCAFLPRLSFASYNLESLSLS